MMSFPRLSGQLFKRPRGQQPPFQFPKQSPASLRCTSQKNSATKSKQSTRRDLLTVLGKKPMPTAKVGGRGSARKDASYGGKGRPCAWYHAHWFPKDRINYPGKVFQDPMLRNKLKQDNARMYCKGCFAEDPHCADIGYNPSTNFENRLLTSCPASRTNAAYSSAEVLDELKNAASEKAIVRYIFALHLALFSAGGPFLPSLSIKLYFRCFLPGQRVPVSVGRVRRDACRWPDSDARSRPALG
jgi:hypothetical protein